MEIDEKILLKYSGIESIEQMKEEIMEWIGRSKRKPEMGGYPDSFCADTIIMIFHCVLYKLREELSSKTNKTKGGKNGTR